MIAPTRPPMDVSFTVSTPSFHAVRPHLQADV